MPPIFFLTTCFFMQKINRGLGHIALQWAAAMGCREIVAISGRDNKKEEAFKLGATKFIKYVYLIVQMVGSCMFEVKTTILTTLSLSPPPLAPVS